MRLPILAGLPLLAIRLALLEWARAAELSCDRGAAMVTRDPLAVCRALMVLSAGEAADDLNLDAFIAQGMDYSESGSGLERMTRLLQDLQITHPMPVRRVRMLLDWVHEGDYDALVRGEYVRRGDEASAREEADAAGAFYGVSAIVDGAVARRSGGTRRRRRSVGRGSSREIWLEGRTPRQRVAATACAASARLAEAVA